MSSYKLGVAVMLTLQVAVLGAPGPAHALTTTVEPIPTDVVGPPRNSQYPQPICNICKVEAASETNSSNQTRGLLFITYEDEVYEDFEGSIKLKVLLSNDTQYVETISDVDIVDTTPSAERNVAVVLGGGRVEGISFSRIHVSQSSLPLLTSDAPQSDYATSDWTLDGSPVDVAG